MKKLLIVLAVLLLAVIAVQAEFKFDGEIYSFGWETKTNNVTIKEYFRGNETTNTWMTLITLQAHPNATEVKEVSGPYFEARKSIVALPPKAHPKKKDDVNDVVLELFLGAPGKTTYMEFVLTRFIKTDSGVYMIVYSHRLPMSNNQNVNVDVVMKKRNALIRELLEIPVESIKQSF
jgi:hypothetical protein